MLEESQVLVASGSGIQTVIPQLATASPQIVYLDFDGAETSYNSEFLTIDNVVMEGSGFDDETISLIVNTLNDQFGDDIVFTADLPQTNEYSTIYVGVTSAFEAYGGFLGLAETIDSGNKIHDDNAFVFLNYTTSLDLVTSVIAHETEHIVHGMEHDGEGIDKYADVISVVSKGQTVNGLVVSSGTSVHVLGIANTMKVSAGGRVDVSSGGTANSMTLYKSGAAIVSNGGVANSTIISGGALNILTGGVANFTSAGTGGKIVILEGGIANDITLTSNGWISAGGTANRTLVNSQGSMLVTTGGTATSTTLAGTMVVKYGGTAVSTTLKGRMIGYNVFEASLEVSSGGNAVSTIVSSGGKLTVSNGGTASDVVVNGKGALLVTGFGTALRVKEQGGAVFVNAGASVTFVPSIITNLDFGLEDSFEITLHSGTTAMSATHTNGFLEIYSGGVADSVNDESVMMVYDGGLAKSTTVWYELHVSNGGTASMTVVSGGSMNVSNGGIAKQTTVNWGSVMVERGGTAVSTTIHSGGLMEVSSGGSASSTTVNASGSLTVSDGGVAQATTVDGSMGRFLVSSGGTATSTTVASGGRVVVYNSGILSLTTIADSGTLFISSGGTVKDLNLSNGGSMVVSSGGVLKGSIVLGGMMTLSGAVNASDASITLDVSQRTEYSSVLIANFYNIDVAKYFVSVSADQGEGMYRLAGKAADFNGSMTLTVKGTNLTTQLSRESVATLAGKDYSLVVNSNEQLILKVEAHDSPVPTNLSGNSTKLSWAAVSGVSGYVVEYSQNNFATVISMEIATTGLEHYNMGAGTWQWRVRAKESVEWAVGNNITISSTGTTPSIVSAMADNIEDAFFAKPQGAWDNTYRARHMGVHNGWEGTGEKVVFGGENRFGDIFQGSTDKNVLLLTDAATGDALFIDDIYTESKNDLAKTQARLANIKEIRAGAGNDIVDLTSDKFDYTGGGLSIHGGLGDDTIWANAGNNTLFGDAGNDRLVGASGNDVIVGGIGNDSMHGGGGNDIFAFGGDWGKDTVEQLSNGQVTLWFDSGSTAKWNASTLTYTDGDKSVQVLGVAASNVTLKFGDDGSAQYDKLLASGAFDEFASDRIFENKNTRGMLA